MQTKKSLSPEEAVEEYFDMLIKSRFIEMFGTLDLSIQKPEWKEIGSLGTILTGSTPKTNNQEFWDGNIKWITPAELGPDTFVINDTERKITEAGRKSCSLNILKPGTVLLTSRAPIGKVAIAGTEMYCNQGFKNIYCGPEINNIYLYTLLKHNAEYLNSLGRGATFKEVSAKIVSNIKIPAPPRKQQDLFEDFVKQVDKSKAICKQIFQSFDNLVKSRFIEMFGTVENNEHDYIVATLSEIFPIITDGTHQTPTYIEDRKNGFKFLSSKDVTSGKICWDNVKYIPLELHTELQRRVSPKRGDILLAKNGTTGICAEVDSDEIFDIYVSLALLRQTGEYNATYLTAAINSTDTKNQFDRSLKGIGVPNLHLSEIKKTKIILPPREKQDLFADFVKQVDKSKFEVVQSLLKLKDSIKTTD